MSHSASSWKRIQAFCASFSQELLPQDKALNTCQLSFIYQRKLIFFFLTKATTYILAVNSDWHLFDEMMQLCEVEMG